MNRKHAIEFHSRQMLAATDQRIRAFHGRMLARAINSGRPAPTPHAGITRRVWTAIKRCISGA